MRSYLNLTRAWTVSFFRQRQQVFWSFFFPVFFIILFGTIFGHADNGSDMKFKVGLVAPAGLPPDLAWMPERLHHIPVLQVEDGTLADEQRRLQEGKIRGVLVIPDDAAARRAQGQTVELRVLTDPTQGQAVGIVGGILQNIVTAFNEGMTGAPAVLRATSEQIAPSGAPRRKSGGMDFMLPGILAMTVMQLGLFTAIPLVMLREKGILKRLGATPVPKVAIVGSQVTQRLIIGFVQAFTLILLGVLLFHFQMTGSWPALLAVVFLGVLTFVCVGAILSAVSKTQETAVSTVQLVNLPMMFLSGMFIPLELLPSGLRSVVGVLPSTHLASLTRHVMVSSPPEYSVPVSVGVMAAWLAGALVIAARTFRWE